MRLCISGFIFSMFVASGMVHAEVTASSRHVVIIQPSVDMLWGSYLLAAENRSAKPEKARLGIIFPAEMVDFKPEEGLAPEDIVLADGDKAHIHVEKAFAPGSTLLGLSFNVQAAGGKAELTFTAPYDVAEFIVMAPQGVLTLRSDDMSLAAAQPFVGKRYDMLRATEFSKGKTIRVHVAGIAEGRKAYWYTGAAFAFVVFFGGFGLALVTRPKGNNEGIVPSE